LDVTLPPTHLHHVGIVVPSDEQASTLMTLLGLEESYRGFVAPYAATCIFTRGNGASPLEFVVPQGGPLSTFNRGAGGLHHVALAVANLEATTHALLEQGIRLLEETPIRGAGNFLCNFLPPGRTRGVIVEFIEELD
jgi:methylmalonyl-CoA/ethylmalonyl-CoA epimerase